MCHRGCRYVGGRNTWPRCCQTRAICRSPKHKCLCPRISRYIWLEFNRKNKEDNFGDELPTIAAAPDFLGETDTLHSCLKSCLSEIPPDTNDRLLILGYYEADENEKNKYHRKNLAEKLDLTMNTLKVKACRLRVRLEKCINECVKKNRKCLTKIAETSALSIINYQLFRQ